MFSKINRNLLLSTALVALPTLGFACESDEMKATESGFIFKVVAGSDKIAAYTDTSATEEAYTLELLQPYFVICEDSDHYKITDLQADTVDEAESGNVGYVSIDQVYSWTTREALSFSEIAFLEDRQEIVAWDDEGVLDKFMETGNAKLHAPAFKENLEATRMRERSTRPYPVLGSEEKLLRKKAKKRVYNVLLPAAITPAARIEMDDDDVAAVEKTLKSASILVVFDATASMGPFATETAKAIAGAVSSLEPEVRDNSEMGFLFYRDEGDAEKLVPVPKMPLSDAANALGKAAEFMSGGGDPAEPILDAIYYAANIYNWDQAGKRIIVAVLNDDAKANTIGTLDEEGRVPAGLDAVSISRDLFEKNIPVLAVQAGPNGGANLMPVLQTLADETGGEVLGWGAGLSPRDVSGSLVSLMTTAAGEAVAKGGNALEKMSFDLAGHASIPLEVLDGEMLERLRAAGVDFNIDPGNGGVLVRNGFVLENNDLLSPEIQIDKETLINLINLYSVLATVGVDEEAMLQSISEAIAAIAGEDYDPEEPIEAIIEKRLGIQFRSDLLNFDLNFLPAMVPAERLAYTKRIQEAANILTQYLEANQTEFDEQIAVWMPIDVLP